METLNKSAAIALIESRAADLQALLDLQQHWIGHRDIADDESAAEVAQLLRDYVDEREADGGEPLTAPPAVALSARAICAQYANFDLNWQAGGGFVAWRHPTNNGGFILITTGTHLDPGAPEDGETTVLAGFYEDDESEGDVEEVDVANLEAWIDAALARGSAK